jgi:hypothetical protein
MERGDGSRGFSRAPRSARLEEPTKADWGTAAIFADRNTFVLSTP